MEYWSVHGRRWVAFWKDTFFKDEMHTWPSRGFRASSRIGLASASGSGAAWVFGGGENDE